jgi:pimeloyl-ACP methyl ester carboxylesterase
MRRAWLLGAVVVVAGCGGGGAPATTTETTPAGAAPAPTGLRARACGDPALAGFRCFGLTVSLHRRGPHARDGRTLTLRVAVERGAAPRGDLLWLAGGPGQAGVPSAPRTSRRLRDATAGYRMVFVDQRGTGATALRCDALQREVGTSDLLAPSARAVAVCARTLGAARDAYATADTVADLEALRRALGVRRWAAGGVSYGTFVAERLALAHPATVSALVLDSVVPQDGAELVAGVPQRAAGRVLPPAAVADLRQLLVADPALGPRLLDALTERSIGVPRLQPFPAALHTALAGDRRPLDALLRAAHEEQTGRIPPAVYSTGLHAATLCADSPAPWPGGSAAPEAVRASSADATRERTGPAATAPFPLSTAFTQGLYVTCRAWPATPAPPALHGAQRITAPALLLAGDHDLSTPLEWARRQLRSMPRGRLVVVPGAGHSVLSRAPGTTARDALRRFLAGVAR